MTNNTISKEVLKKGKAIIKAQLKNEGRHQQKPVFFVQSVERYDAVSDEIITEAAIVKDINFVRVGYYGLNATALKVLEVIVAHIDKDGFSYVSQDKIADILGITRQSVNGALHKYLLEGTDKKTGQPRDVYYGGKLLLKSVKLPAPNGHMFTLYHPVNAFVDHTAYVPDDELVNDVEDYEDYEDDTPVITMEELEAMELNDTVDAVNIAEKKEKANPVGEDSLFIMPVIDSMEDTKESTSTIDISMEDSFVTDIVKKDEKNVDIFAEFLETAKEIKEDAVKADVKPKANTVPFKKGKQSEAGREQSGAKKYKSVSIDADNDKALELFAGI